MKRLKNKVAFITGAAAGIGKTTAKLFAEEGARVFLTDVDLEGAQKVVDQIQEKGGKAIADTLDVTNEEEWIAKVKKAVDEFGTIDILFNNAGIYIIDAITKIDVATWNKLMAINVTGVFLGMKHVGPVMTRQKSGSIINASSIAGLKGGNGHILYGASKGAVRIMTKDMAVEFGPDNVRVNSIHPGYIKTEMVEYASKKTNLSLEELGADYPLRRLGERREVANAVLFLASEESSYITGTEIIIDGGITAKV